MSGDWRCSQDSVVLFTRTSVRESRGGVNTVNRGSAKCNVAYSQWVFNE